MCDRGVSRFDAVLSLRLGSSLGIQRVDCGLAEGTEVPVAAGANERFAAAAVGAEVVGH
jgi:hypothetical protein